ncbi:MAG: PaaI family thioesterase [Proteobacteria bacterium]|nr:PaaI family thioesterase [Pseudomonadota bacterium]
MAKETEASSKRPIFLKPGHNAGDLVESYKWKILREERGLVEVDVHLPDHLLNPRNQLFGGFTGTYVDIMSIYTTRTLFTDSEEFRWAATVNMRIDYFAPVQGPRFLLKGEVINDGRTTCLIATHFTAVDGTKLAYAITTMRKSA